MTKIAAVKNDFHSPPSGQIKDSSHFESEQFLGKPNLVYALKTLNANCTLTT